MSNIKYVNITKYEHESLILYLDSNKKDNKSIVLVYMPDIDYSHMQEFESEAVSRGYRFIALPITLPLMDISKQIEYAGLSLPLTRLRDNIREMIIDALNTL